jgi:hypothetical protein
MTASLPADSVDLYIIYVGRGCIPPRRNCRPVKMTVVAVDTIRGIMRRIGDCKGIANYKNHA